MEVGFEMKQLVLTGLGAMSVTHGQLFTAKGRSDQIYLNNNALDDLVEDGDAVVEIRGEDYYVVFDCETTREAITGALRN